MKKLFLLFLSLLFATCTTLKVDKAMVVTAFDFSKYSKQNFLITPDSYNGDYESIGLISASLFASVTETELPTNMHENGKFSWETDSTYLMFSVNKYYLIEKINTEEVVEELFQTVKRMGGDAITNLKTNFTYRERYGIYIPGVELTGFAIKRK